MSYACLAPSPSSSFSAYVAWAQKQPNITEQKERSLLQRYKDHADLDAVKELLVSHLKYVISIASGYLGYGLLMQDLVQEGSIGLMKAVKRFDLEHPVRLATFAVYWIKSEIHEYVIRNWRMVKIATTKAQRKLFFRLRKQLNYERRVQENLQAIAENAGTSLQDVQLMYGRMMCQEESLESQITQNDNELSLGDTLSVSGDNPSEHVAFLQGVDARVRYVHEALQSLNARERWIVENRWVLEDGQEKMTLDVIANQLGVSIERVRQLEAQALKRMKKFFEEKNIAFLDF